MSTTNQPTTTFDKIKKLPGSLSLQRASVISDGSMYSGLPDGSRVPLHILYHGLRGTQNVAGDKEKNSAVGNAKGRNVSNIQQTESAKLATGADHLVVEYRIRYLDLSKTLFACAPSKDDSMEQINQFKAALEHFIEQAKTSEGLREVACRYVRNMVNGRWLWRNRMAAERIIVNLSIMPPSGESHSGPVASYDFNAFDYPLNQFANYSEAELKLAQVVQDNLAGKSNHSLRVTAKVYFGMGDVEVFPSQNYLEKKPDGFARSLYQLGNIRPEKGVDHNQILGQAALRDQKIGNALRTIDTWYPAFATRQQPIPIEPNGASLDAQQFFRDKTTSAFDLIKNIGNLSPDTPEGMFMIAALIRGGVYSEGGAKDKETSKNDQAE